MNVAILSRNKNLYSTRRLVEAGSKRGHDVSVVDTLRCYMNMATAKPSIRWRGRPLSGVDAVISRVGASITFYGTAVVRQFEMMGVYALNESVAISRSRDKLRSMQLLARLDIGMPVTGFAHTTDDIPDLISMVGGAPLVVKLLEGTQGVGVVLCDTKQAAESVIEAFLGIDVDIMVQEYIAESAGSDIRCLVLGDRVIAAMRRQAKPGEFRSNLHRGGTAEIARISPAERRTAVAAARTVGLNLAGVDLIRSNHGPLVLEVNSSPGLEGIETATGVDIADLVFGFIERNAKPGRTRTRGKG